MVFFRKIAPNYWFWPVVFLGLYVTSHYNYLIFHTIVELFSISIAWMMFGIIWPQRDKQVNGFYFILATAYLFIGFIDLIHTMAYKGLNLFKGYDANLPTQLWIAARYLEALTLFAVFSYLKSQPNRFLVLINYSIISLLAIFTIFMRSFPDCYIEGKGLTTFKIVSEYIITVILVLAVWRLRKNKAEFSQKSFQLIQFAIVSTICSEIMFTFYISVYGLSNLIGHYFKLISFYFVYKAIAETSINEPYMTIFKDLKEKETELLKEKELLCEALKRVQTLEGLLPICSSCKKIRDEKDNWVPIESYIEKRSEAKFTHGICPECAEKLYSEFYKKKSSSWQRKE